MLTYEEMEYLAAFAEYGTLTEVAEKFLISQPTITRAMKKAEAVFGVPLFDRTKNRIHLNKNGELAAREVSLLLKQTDDAISRVQAYDRANRTISIGTAAAVQLPELISRVTRTFPEKAVSTELKLPEELIEGLVHQNYQMIVLPWDPNEKGWDYDPLHPDTPASLRAVPPDCISRKIGEEHLLFFLPRSHRYARRKRLSLAEMNGENMLLYSDIGFWAQIVRSKMPDSRFLVQSERYSFEELVANSVLPCFITNLTGNLYPPLDRATVPITDPEVNVSYYLLYPKSRKREFGKLFA
ncbi:MAG: LysR family transcriptional regulator [Acutalibacteraceae bacterium]